jgi:hypothetical protein
MDDHESTQAAPEQPHIAGAYLPEEPPAADPYPLVSDSYESSADHAHAPDQHPDGKFKIRGIGAN